MKDKEERIGCAGVKGGEKGGISMQKSMSMSYECCSVLRDSTVMDKVHPVLLVFFFLKTLC